MTENTRKFTLSLRLFAGIAAIMVLALALGGLALYETHRLENALPSSQASFFVLRAATIILIVLIGAGTAFLTITVVYRVLFPVRKLARKTAGPGGEAQTDDLELITTRVYQLLEDVGKTRNELERSRAQLLHSEKMAVVGKLAADVAHSIRNPMTSIKMRLFSLERSLPLNSAQKEDFEVVSEEMRRLDNILRNFLEFSRPPKLRMQMLSLSEIVDQTLQLLQHRLEMCNVRVEHYRGHFLPDLEADPELFKEVLVNLIVNACDAMKDGGRLIISEEEAVAEHIGRALVIKVADTGPGIPDPIQDKVLEPFFSTKEEGTGLGLSIALRIVEEHGGRLELRSEEGKGATFIITLPLREEEA